MAGYDTLGTSLVINDGMSKVLKNIINTTNMLVQSFRNMQNHARTNIPTNIGDNIRNSIVRAENELRNYERTLNQISGRSINNTIHTNIENLPSMQNPVQPLDNMSNWNRMQGINIIDASGSERLQKEMNDYRNMVTGISNIQDKLKNNIGLMDKSLLPQNAISDITHAENRVNNLIQSMQKLSNADMAKLNTSQVESMNNSFESMRQNASSMINVMSNLNTSISSGNINGLNSGFNQLNNLVEQAERQIRNTGQALNEINKPLSWDRLQGTSTIDASGSERLQKEMNDYRNMVTGISNIQDKLKNNIGLMDKSLLPQNAISDIAHAENRVNSLIQSMQRLSSADMSLLNNSQLQSMNSSFESLRQNASSIINTISSINTSLPSGNIEAVNSGFQQLNSLAQQAEHQIRNTNEALNAINNTQWQNDFSMTHFNSDGLIRMRQEVMSANNMINNLVQTQQRITQESARMRLIPPQGINDINNLNSRISNIQNTIRNLEREQNRLLRWDTAGVNQYNSRIEHLRGQLSQVIQIQNEWNNAIASNDIQRVNSAYSSLKNIVDSIDLDIRNNTSAQNQFNNSLANGSRHTEKLKNGIKSVISSIGAMAGAYGSVRMAQAGIKASDDYSNKKARLGLLSNNEAELKSLQNETFKSAISSRGKYSDSINSVAKLGLLAPEAFTGNNEIVKFSELMNKSFAISGAGVQEQSAGMYQLVQAMAAGKLQGDEFRSIMENAPLLAQSIAEYTGRTKAELKDMSRQGQITSDVIKNALFSSADDINAKFAQIPNTFGSMLNQIKSTATMEFSPVMEQFNNALNQIDTNTLISKLLPSMNFASMKLSQFGSYISEIAANAAPNINVLTGGFSDVGRYILSANGLAGTFMGTLNTMLSNNSLAGFINSIAGGFKFFVQSIEWGINGIGWLSENFAGLFPIVGGVVTSFMTFNMVNGLLNGGLKGVNTIIGGVSRTMSFLTSITNHQALAAQTQALATNAQTAANANLTLSTAAQAAITNTSTISTIAQSSANNNQAISANTAAAAATSNAAALTAQAAAANSANIAQSGLNAALRANPFGLVASAVIKVVSVMASLVSAIKAVNAAANIASEQANVGGYSDEVWQRHQRTGESLQTIQQQMDEGKNYRDFLASNTAATEAAEEKLKYARQYVNDLKATPNVDQDTINIRNDNLKRAQNELKQLQSQRENRVKSYEQRMRNISAQELQSKNLEFQMRGISVSGISNLSGGSSNMSGSNINTVGSVGSVENVNDTIDITSEDLRYMREFAEREAINQFTQQTLAPQITVTFGDVKVKEEADARIIADKIADILNEQMNVSSNIVPAT